MVPSAQAYADHGDPRTRLGTYGTPGIKRSRMRGPRNMSRQHYGRPAKKHLRIRLRDNGGHSTRTRVVNAPFTLGYGRQCDLRVANVDGPDVLFELQQFDGPVLIARGAEEGGHDRFAELKLDREPIRGAWQPLASGSCLEVVDKSTGRRFEIVIDPPRFGVLGGRRFVWALAALVVLATIAGVYFYSSLRSVEQQLDDAESRQFRELDRLDESLRQLGGQALATRKALDDFAASQLGEQRRLREAFADRLSKLETKHRAQLYRLEGSGQVAIAELKAQNRRALDALRKEFSKRLTAAYEESQKTEQRLLNAMTRQLAEIVPEGEHFKQMFHKVRQSTLLVRVDYTVEFPESERQVTQTAFGTGFLADSEGLAITARHLLIPWEYDEELVVLRSLDMARVDENNVRIQAWTIDSKVDPDAALAGNGTSFHRESQTRRLSVVYVRSPDRAKKLVSTPFGAMLVGIPIPGASDCAIIKLQHLDDSEQQPFTPVTLSKTDPDLEPLDDVLVVGYPLSRLAEERSAPQGLRGFVRQQNGELLELDAALHPGVSGGPVFARDGHLAGMVTAILDSEVYGIAISATEIRKLLIDFRSEAQRSERTLGGPRP